MLTKRTDAILITGVLLLGIGLILHIVGVATTAWMYFKDNGAIYYGLFEVCGEIQCVEYPKTSSDLKTVQALTITGAVLAGLALIMSIIFSAVIYNGKTVSKKLAVFTGLEALLAALLIFVGCIVFVVRVYNEANGFYALHLRYSFFLCIVASGLIGLSGILVWIGGHRIITVAVPQPGQVMTPGGPPMAVVYQASGTGAVYAPINYQSNDAGSTYPPPQISPQQHTAYPPQQYAAYPPQLYAVYPPQQFPATGSVAQPPYQPPAEEKNTT